MAAAATQAVNFLTPNIKTYNFILVLLSIITWPTQVPQHGWWIAHSLKERHLEKLFSISDFTQDLGRFRKFWSSSTILSESSWLRSPGFIKYVAHRRSVEGTQIQSGSANHLHWRWNKGGSCVGEDLARGVESGTGTKEAPQQPLALPYLQSPPR
jgi:hypothetical protein